MLLAALILGSVVSGAGPDVSSNPAADAYLACARSEAQQLASSDRPTQRIVAAAFIACQRERAAAQMSLARFNAARPPWAQLDADEQANLMHRMHEAYEQVLVADITQARTTATP